MKAVIAIDSFKGSMDSIEAGEAAEKGIRRVFTDAEAIVYPLADGGEGTVQALAKGLGGKLEKVKVTGPLGEPVICEYGIVEEKTAIIEMAGAAGITLVQPKLRNPLNTTTYGVGEVIKDAIGKGCRHFIIGIGGSATNDGGIGMLQALGAEFLDEGGKQVPFGARGVEKLASINCEHILFELKECDFRIACDVDNPLCGRKWLQPHLWSAKRCNSKDGRADGSVDEEICKTDRRIFPNGWYQAELRFQLPWLWCRWRSWVCIPRISSWKA